MNVLKFLNKKEIENFFDKQGLAVIDYLLKKVLFSQPELLPNQKTEGIQMPKEFLEQWIAQGLGWKRVGSGSYPIDVYSDQLKIGVDVKSVTAKIDNKGAFKQGTSGESSLGQKFKDAGSNLDQDFKNKEYEKILASWKGILLQKINKPIDDYKLKKIFYFIFIRGGNSIYLAVAEVSKKEIKNLTVGNATNTSLLVKGFVDDKYGNVKIYKSKKRMELRCLPQNLYKDNLLISWDFTKFLKGDPVVLRDIVNNKKSLEDHIQGEIQRFFN